MSTPLRKQLFGTGNLSLLVITGGACMGFSAVLLPQLKVTDNFSTISQEEESWIAAIMPLSVILGTLFAGFITDRFGRVMLNQIGAIPMTTGWIIIGAARHTYLLLLGRFLAGFSMGLQMPIGAVYIGEISSPEYRGVFLAFISLGISVGITLSHILGTFFRWQIAALILSLIPFISGVLFSFLPETPSWLISKRRFEEGREAFKWYRGEKSVEVELMIEKVVNETVNKTEKNKTFKEIYANLKTPEFIKPLIILIIFFFMLQFSGNASITFYAVKMFKNILKGNGDEYTAMIYLDSLRLLSSVIACAAIRRFRRRTATLISGFTSTVFTLGIVGYLYAKDHRLISDDYTWIPLTLLSLYIITSSMGIVALPWCLQGELFPMKTRGLGSALSSVSSSAFLFFSSKTAPAMFNSFGMSGTFLFYSIISLVGTTTMIFILPETKGKTLQEIEENFKTAAKRDIDIEDPHS